jgi:hypothetical protein
LAPAPWFYEALVSYSRSSIPFGDGYEARRKEMAQRDGARTGNLLLRSALDKVVAASQSPNSPLHSTPTVVDAITGIERVPFSFASPEPADVREVMHRAVPPV